MTQFPRTTVPIGYRRDGRPIFPILGGDLTVTLDALIERAQANLTGLLAQRDGHTSHIRSLSAACRSAGRDLNAAEIREVNEAQEAREALAQPIEAARAHLVALQREQDADNRDVELSRQRNETDAGRQLREQQQRGHGDQERRVGGAVVGREARTYSRETSMQGRSWVADAWRMQRGDLDSRQRIERHAQEVTVEREMSARAASTGSFAGLIPPQYLTNQAALIARAGRPFANTVQHLPLPEEGMSFVIPRGTVGLSSASQALENSAVSQTDPSMTNLTVPVATIAGQAPVSRQSIERGTPGLDEMLFMDGVASYTAELGRQVIAGSGASGQLLGTLNTAGISQATAFGAAATGQTAYSKIAGQVNAVETLRFLAPTAIAMHPRRWNWWLTQFDQSGRPYVVPNANGPMNSLGVSDSPVDTNSASPVGQMFGLPVITDPNIPTGVGSGPEDQIIVYRGADLLLWEDGDGMPNQLRFEQTYGNQLTVDLVWYGYVAFTAGRYPTAVGVIGGNAAAGNGLVAPAF